MSAPPTPMEQANPVAARVAEEGGPARDLPLRVDGAGQGQAVSSRTDDPLLVHERGWLRKSLSLFGTLSVLALVPAAGAAAMVVLSLPLLLAPDWDFLSFLNRPFIFTSAMFGGILAFLAVGASETSLHRLRDRAFAAWLDRLSPPRDDPFLPWLKRRISDAPSPPDEHARRLCERVMSSPSPSDEAVVELARALPVPASGWVPKRMQSGIAGLASTGVLVDRPALAALIRRIDFPVPEAALTHEGMPHVAELVRARFWAEQALGAMLRGEITADEARERLVPLAWLADGAAEGLGAVRELEPPPGPPRPDLVDGGKPLAGS